MVFGVRTHSVTGRGQAKATGGVRHHSWSLGCTLKQQVASCSLVPAAASHKLPPHLLELILFLVTSIFFPVEIYAAPAAAEAAAAKTTAADRQQAVEPDEVVADTSDFTNNLLLKNLSDVAVHLKEQQAATEAAVDAAAAEVAATVKAEQAPQEEPENHNLLIEQTTADSGEVQVSDRARLAHQFEKVVPVASPAGSAIGTTEPLPYKSERNDVISGASPHNADQKAIAIDPENLDESQNQMLQSYAQSPAYAPVYKDREQKRIAYVRQSRDDMLLNTMVHIHINHIAKAQNLINQWRNEDVNRFFAQEQVQALFANKRHSRTSVVGAKTMLVPDEPEQALRHAENDAAAGNAAGGKGAQVTTGGEPGLKDQIGQLYHITGSGYGADGLVASPYSTNAVDSYERAFYEQDLEVRIRQDLNGSFATAESGDIRGHELTADPRSGSSLISSLSALHSKGMAQAYRYDDSNMVNQNRGIALVVKDKKQPVYINQEQGTVLSSQAAAGGAKTNADTEDIVIDVAGTLDSQEPVDINQIAGGNELAHINLVPEQSEGSPSSSWTTMEHMGITQLDKVGNPDVVVDPMSYPSVTFKADADQIDNTKGDTSNVVSSLARTRYLAVSASTPYIPEKYQPKEDRLKLLNSYEDTVTLIQPVQSSVPSSDTAYLAPGSTSFKVSETAAGPTGATKEQSVGLQDNESSAELVPLPYKPPLNMGKVGNAASELVSEAKNRLTESLFGDDEDTADSEELKAADIRLVKPVERNSLTNSLINSTNNVVLDHIYDRASFYVDGRESVSSHAATPDGKGRMPSIKARHGRKIVFLTKPDGLDALGRPIPPFAEEHGDYIRYCRQFLKHNGNNNQYGTFIYGTNTLQPEDVSDEISEAHMTEAAPGGTDKEAELNSAKIKVDAITGE